MTSSSPSALTGTAPEERAPARAPEGRRASRSRAALAGLSASVALILAGVALRLVEYLSGRALWLDESYLWSNLDRLSPVRLTGPLDLAQGAPIPFLLAEKGVVETLGDGEWALRLLPLVAGIALMPLVFVLASRVLPPERAWLAVAPVALGHVTIFYSSEMKQYGLDALIAALLLWALVAAASAPMTRRNAVALAAAGAAGVWCSDPAAFVLAGGGVALLVQAAAARDRERLRALIAATAAWLVSFGALYVVHVRDLAVVRGIATAGTDDGSGAALWEILRGTTSGMQFSIGRGLLVPLLTQALVLLGLAALWRSGRRVEAGILGLPLAALVLAALLGQYPTQARFTVFLAPALAVAFAAGALAVWDAARARGRALAALVAVTGAVCALPVLGRLSDTSLASEELDTVTAAISDRMEPGDQIYLSCQAQYAYAYYGPRHGIGFAPRRASGSGAGTGEDFCGAHAPVLASGPGRVVGRWYPSPSVRVRDVDRMRGAGRFWMVFSHHDPGEATAIVRRARAFARPVGMVRADGAFAVLMGRR